MSEKINFMALMNKKIDRQLKEGDYKGTIISLEPTSEDATYWKLRMNVLINNERVKCSTMYRYSDKWFEILQQALINQFPDIIFETLAEVIEYAKENDIEFYVEKNVDETVANAPVYYNWRLQKRNANVPLVKSTAPEVEITNNDLDALGIV